MSDPHATGSRAAKLTDFRAGYEFGYCDGQVGEYQPEKHPAAHATPDRRLRQGVPEGLVVSRANSNLVPNRCFACGRFLAQKDAGYWLSDGACPSCRGDGRHIDPKKDRKHA